MIQYAFRSLPHTPHSSYDIVFRSQRLALSSWFIVPANLLHQNCRLQCVTQSLIKFKYPRQVQRSNNNDSNNKSGSGSKSLLGPEKLAQCVCAVVRDRLPNRAKYAKRFCEINLEIFCLDKRSFIGQLGVQLRVGTSMLRSVT